MTSTVDTEARTVTALISRFTQFALMGTLSVPTPAPAPILTPVPTQIPTPPPPPPNPNWYIIGGFIAAVIVIGAVIWVLVAR